jgi:peptidoglycan lytic transglycosylase
VIAPACAVLGGCAQPERAGPSETAPAASAPAPPEAETAAPVSQRGRISLYGKDFAGKRTASGEVFDPERLTMAHRTLPFGTRVRVTNLENQRSVEVIVNDRGPFVRGRIADLSAGAARQIEMVVDGVVDALLEVLQPAKAR